MGRDASLRTASALVHVRSRSVRGFPPSRKAWYPQSRRTTSPRRSAGRLHTYRERGASREADREVFQRSHGLRRCLPRSHDRNACRSHHPHDRPRFPSLPSPQPPSGSLCDTRVIQLTGALEDFVNREIPFEDEMTAKFNLLNGVEAPEFHGLSLALGELGAEDQGPIFEPIADDFWTQTIRGRLQSLGIRNREEGIVVLPEGDLLAEKFLFHKGMAIDVVGGMKGEKRCDPHDHGAENFIAQVEVVVREAAALFVQDAVVGIGGGKLGQDGAKGLALLQAFENEVHAMLVLALHAAERERT